MPFNTQTPNAVKVTAAWQKIHTEHPEIYGVANPKLITRMKFRDFPKVIQSACTLTESSTVLEPGCGSGRDSLYFSYLGCNCTAVDINDAPLQKLDIARERLSLNRLGKPLQLHTKRADIFQLPYPDNSFDLVFNSGVVEHYDDATRTVLIAEMTRLTKPGGNVAVVFPNKHHVLGEFWERLIKKYTDFNTYDIPEQPLDEKFVDSLKEHSLEVVLYDWLDCYDTISHYPNWLPLRALAFAANAVLPRPPISIRKKLGTRSIVVARKV